MYMDLCVCMHMYATYVSILFRHTYVYKQFFLIGYWYIYIF